MSEDLSDYDYLVRKADGEFDEEITAEEEEEWLAEERARERMEIQRRAHKCWRYDEEKLMKEIIYYDNPYSDIYLHIEEPARSFLTTTVERKL